VGDGDRHLLAEILAEVADLPDQLMEALAVRLGGEGLPPPLL
jgi:hypothetical protein